jgi:hypothetical protein
MINLIRVTRKAGWTSTRLAREGRGTVAAGPRTGDMRIHIVSVRGWPFVTPQTVARDLMMVCVAAGAGSNALGRECRPAMALRTRHALVFAMIERKNPGPFVSSDGNACSLRVRSRNVLA